MQETRRHLRRLFSFARRIRDWFTVLIVLCRSLYAIRLNLLDAWCVEVSV